MSLASSTLFGRSMTCTIAGVSASWNAANGQKKALLVSGNDIEASVHRNLIGRSPNTAHIRIYNLSSDHLRQLASGNGSKFPVVLTAGYKGTSDTVFSGTARYAWADNMPEGGTVLNIRSGDLEEACLSRVAAPAAPKTSVQQALPLLAGAMGAGTGNLTQALGQVAGSLIQSVRPGALFGSAMDRMTEVTKSAGLTWSIQNGDCQFLPLGKSLGNQAFEIGPDSGMVGSPSVDNKGLLKFETLLIPGLGPGMAVKLNAAFVKGYFRIERCEWNLSTFANNFYMRCEGIAVPG